MLELLYKLLQKKNTKNFSKPHTPSVTPVNINPKEFIILAEYLIDSRNIKHQLLGIMMLSGIPLAHLTNKIIVIQKRKNTLVYRSDTDIEISRNTLIEARDVIFAIKRLARNFIPTQARELNKILKKLFGTSITTKSLEKIYNLVLIKKIRVEKQYLDDFDKSIIKYDYKHDIKLINKPIIKDLNDKINYINSFNILNLNKNNLQIYKKGNSRVKSIIAFLIEDFFNANSDNYYKNTLCDLKSYINLRLKDSGINYKDTCKSQQELFYRVLDFKRY
ncbi:hypothetical protein [Candidatus Borreliella tachyglossi]|uniref:hypothetical protein n=1 Tax=Candidatus Borreliella tachyglossi TaxID=1964448 RepID=UPI00404134A1